MKKIITAAVIAGMFVSFGGVCTIAATDNTPERGTLSVSTNADAEVSPDTVDIRISIKTKDSKSMQKASNENKLTSDNIYNALKGFINSQNGDYLKTADYNARPIYTYTSNNKRVFDRYEVSNNIIVHTKNIEQVGAMIDKAISLGATDVSDLRFSVSNYEKQCNELLEIASKKAKTRADITAKASGSYITGVKNLSISCSENTPNRVQYRLMMNKAASDGASYEAASAPSTPIQSGVIRVFANLSAVYFIK